MPTPTPLLNSSGASPQVAPSRSVFINCPYDQEYEPLFDALVFTIICCGFIPRSATESGLVAESRMNRIFHALKNSGYSIHDLSRCRGEGENVFARFNMPLELGIAMSRRNFEPSQGHDWLVLVPENASYTHFISDLAGYDLKKYDGEVASIIQKVLSWLVTKPEAIQWKPKQIIEKLSDFRKAKAELKADWNEIPWHCLVKAAIDNVPVSV